MGVRTSNKATESTVKDFKYWSGVIPFQVLAINPNLAELKKIGIEYMQKEPEYILEQNFDENVVKNTILDFWVKSVPLPEYPELEIVAPLRFRINHDTWTGSNTGKKQYINKYGRTAWAADMESLNENKYYKNEGSRLAHRGEDELHKFLFAWLNMSYDDSKETWDDCLINIDKVIKGDVSELKEVVQGSLEYVVKLLVGVNVVEKDGKIRYYQALYNQMFLKHNQTSTNRMQEYIGRDEFTEFKADYYSFDIREFDKSVKPDTDPEKEEMKQVF